MRIGIGALALLAIATLAHAEVIYVDIDATGANDGTSWADAYVDLQDGLAYADRWDEVWVAEGTYYPTPTRDQQFSFVLPQGVALYGGFSGIGTERDPELFETILSGDIGEQRPPGDEPNAGKSYVRDNSIQVVVAKPFDWDSPRIDGVTITSCASFLYPAPPPSTGLWIEGGNITVENVVIRHTHGLSGIVVKKSDAHLKNVRFENNEGNSGGGLTLLDASPVLENVQFIENFSYHLGGGLYSEGSDPIVMGARFIGNRAFMGGGGATFSGGSPTVDRAWFTDNYGAHDAGGGGMLVEGGTAAEVSNSLFVNNSASVGGAIANYGGSVVVLSSTIFGNGQTNSVTGIGGAIYTYHQGTALVANTLCWDNEQSAESTPIAYEQGSLTWIHHSIVQGAGGSGPQWDSRYGADSGGNLDVSPEFMDPAAEDYRLVRGSPAVDAGDSYSLPFGVDEDLEGNPRVVGAAIDMGCYEHQGVVKIDDGPTIPPAPAPARHLYAAPNPFNPSTTIYYGTPEAGHVELTVYDLAGRRVKTLVSGHVGTGNHEVDWDGRDEAGKRVSSGVYLYQLKAGEYVESKRMVMVK